MHYANTHTSKIGETKLGIQQETVNTIYKGAILPLMLYGAPVWIQAVEKHRVILSVLDPRKCEYLKDYSLDFEHAYRVFHDFRA